MVYIRQRNLPKLHEYKYAGVDKSLVSKYILKPFYTNVVIKCFPMSMAPNLITLTGFSFVILNFITLLWYNPTLSEDMPPWVYLSFSIGLFLYQTFDAVDGSQARRTHQSGPLGELFDHGVDACNTSLEVLLFAGAMNLGQSWNTVLTLFGAVLTFYIQTWDEYHTHQLTLGVVSGPVEGVLTLVGVFFVTYLKGRGSYWQQPMLPAIGVPKTAAVPDALYQQSWAEWWMLFGGLVLTYNTVSSIRNVMKARRERGQDPMKPLLGLAPLAITWTLIPAYLWLNPIILHRHLIPFVLFAGIVNAYSVGQMIVRHLVKDRFPYKNILLLPLAWGVFDSLGPKLGLWPSALGGDTYQVAFVFMMTGLAFGVYGSFVHDVITTICDFLDIWCLTIKHPYKEGEPDGEVKKSK
ncbi:putative CDP-alcohol phosphatidyltransferase class-I family protein [Cyphellophora attinorum]|uniref:diacylglycerol cholinephosphotransferase n=1 Tax=Cyphellophora attinorum TaxID=1664694 RepID=A0A0N1H7N8_9EURO|nr:putative CDP-alcohol phosphatidyltransferase class-I family protein [Phialophora attinorum]KPI42584.1 putative CDP-alcohol phosphatidyltransferase class-I family protein [Phialophora attinorum]